MARRGKKYRDAAATLEPGVKLDARAALERVKEMAYAGFDETVDVAVRLGVDPRHAEQVVRGTVVLPAGTGRTMRVLALVQGEAAREAEAAGADFVGLDHVGRIEEGWLEFDVAIATPDVMKTVAKLGRILGPRGLMPTPKAGTVTTDVSKAVKDAKGGKIEFRVDRTGVVHAPIGKVSFSIESLSSNLGALMDALLRQKPSSAKGTYVRSVTVSSTMGPGVSIDPNLYRRVA